VTLVAISAAYGAGGSRVGPAVAQQLGVPFVDRAILLAVAERLDVPVDAATAHDEQADGGSWLERVLRGFIGVDAGAPTPLPPDTFSSEDFQRATEEVLTRQAATGEGVILGRGAVVVLSGDPRVLRVRLTGPVERRIQQAMKLQGLERETAERALRRFDRTHAEYLRQFYGAEIDDPALYHLTIDSTSISIDGSVELIAAAARSLTADPAPA
jgi:cytidylate kinase